MRSNSCTINTGEGIFLEKTFTGDLCKTRSPCFPFYKRWQGRYPQPPIERAAKRTFFGRNVPEHNIFRKELFRTNQSIFKNVPEQLIHILNRPINRTATKSRRFGRMDLSPSPDSAFAESSSPINGEEKLFFNLFIPPVMLLLIWPRPIQQDGSFIPFVFARRIFQLR